MLRVGSYLLHNRPVHVTIFGLHQYLDRTQLRLIEICNAVGKTYCEWLEEEPAA